MLVCTVGLPQRKYRFDVKSVRPISARLVTGVTSTSPIMRLGFVIDVMLSSVETVMKWINVMIVGK